MKFNDNALKDGIKGLKKATKKQISNNLIKNRRDFSLKEGNPKEIDKYQQYIIAFNIEKWLTELKGYTFPTTFVSVSQKNANDMISVYEQNKSTSNGTPSKRSFTEFARLIEELDSEMKSFGECCFVKTSSRSAKDFADPSILKDRFSKIYSLLDNNENSKLIAISYASMELLKMKSSQQVITNLTNSERIWHDMKLALAQKSHWQEALVIRQWVDIEPDMEFRCFIVNNKLTCISQYRHLIHFPRLVASEALIHSQLISYIDSQIKPVLSGKFPKDDYILDLAIELKSSFSVDNILADKSLIEEDITKIWVVEVNPFFETTDGCLFSWSLDEKLIFNENVDKPLMRIRKKPSKGATSLIYGVWKDILNSA